jgi:hypothetical protein
MRAASITCGITLAVALALSACAVRGPESQQADEAYREAAAKIAEGHSRVLQRDYGCAVDAFVAAAGDSDVASDAASGAADAVRRAHAGDRLPGRLDGVLMLQKRLPSGMASNALRATVTNYLVDPVAEQARQAAVLLQDRRAFVQQMREQNQADVLSTPTDKRMLTEAEVVEAQSRMQQLRVPASVVRLYTFERPLAAAMDRFLADDERYLGRENVTDNELDEIDHSCDALGDALWPVQRQLDRVRPGWRQTTPGG